MRAKDEPVPADETVELPFGVDLFGGDAEVKPDAEQASMTPAEQGQERWTIRAIRSGSVVNSPFVASGPSIPEGEEIEVVPAEELEMCQRYFPFLQRSRADYKRRYEEAEHNLAELRKLWEPLGRRAEAAETARDEAVKREKALAAELARLTDGDWIDDAACHDQMCSYRAEHGRITDFERLHGDLLESQQRERAFVRALKKVVSHGAASPSGTARWLAQIARAALDQSGKGARPGDCPTCGHPVRDHFSKIPACSHPGCRCDEPAPADQSGKP